VFDGNKRSVFFWLLSSILETKRFKQWLRFRYWNSEQLERYLFWLEILFLCGWFQPKSYKFYTSLTLNLVQYFGWCVYFRWFEKVSCANVRLVLILWLPKFLALRGTLNCFDNKIANSKYFLKLTQRVKNE